MTIRVVHVITGLPVGGAEMVLLGIATAGRESGIEPAVICLGSRGPVSELLEQENIVVHHLGMRSFWQFPVSLPQLRSVLRNLRPDLIQGWMYHGNLAATVASLGADVPVAWNVRQSLHRVDLFKVTTRLTIRANAGLSRRANSIIYNSRVARQQHEAIGFWPALGMRIPNGVDLRRFSSDRGDRDRIRRNLNIADDETVIISVGRVHPIKGHEVLMHAIGPVVNNSQNVRFLVVGKGADLDSEPFSAFAAEAAIRERTLLLGERDNVAELLAAADIFVSASHTEGFPNAVAEAMAARLPCVVTDVGDSRLLVGDFGRIVAAGDAPAVANALLEMTLQSPRSRHEIGDGARARIERKYSLPKVAQRYADHYLRLVRGANQTQSA